MLGSLRSRFARLAAGVALACAAAGAHAAGLIELQASAAYEDQHGNAVSLQSNVVVSNVGDGSPTITFYTDATFSQRAYSTSLGQALYVGVDARSCNVNHDAVEKLELALWSADVQQKLLVDAVETAPGSGIFRFQVPSGGLVDASQTAVGSKQFHFRVPTSRATNTQREMSQAESPVWVPAATNDVLQAHIEGCGYGSATSDILIDPSGVVFDSGNNGPVAGAVVTLIDVDGTGNGGFPGRPATVLLEDGVSAAPSTVTTGADGRFTFPLIAASNYRLDIAPPNGYVYPSKVAPASLPPKRNIQAAGSYHGVFAVKPSIGDMLVDLPLDEIPHGMSVTKTASRTNAEIAESVGYTVIVRNVGNVDLDRIDLQDTLPTGFEYLRSSATLDNAPAAEPAGGKGPALTFSVPSMAAGQTRTLRYRATIGPLALQGDGVNRAQARAALPFATVSNVAAATVQVQPGVFTDRAMVLGKVWADCNADGLQDDGEPGVPGVRLIMEDGSFVVTDGKGQYSFYGVSPRTHVLKLDATTLPAGTAPTATSSRNAGDGASRFVDPRAGELHRADFALSGCSKSLDAVIALRVGSNNELSSALKMDFRADGGAQPSGDVRAQPASGLIGEAQGADGTRYVTVKALAGAAVVSHIEAAPVAEQTLAQRVSTLDNALAFVDLNDGQALDAAQATVRVKGPSQARLALSVDGQDVGEERVGTRVQDERRQLQARDYVGLPLPAGDHALTLTASDPFGNVRATARVTVRAPGGLARIALALPAPTAAADGETMVPVDVSLEDARGVPVTARTAITLDASAGEWDAADLDPREAGVQTFIEGGHARFHLRAPRAPGTAELRAASGKVAAKGKISFVPALRPLIAAGIVEGAFNLHKLGAGSILSAGAADGFEAQLNDFANGGGAAGGRAALYLKGKVLGSSLLTLGYDSAKESNAALFRDIQPDQFYPVYGDSSAKGFDAQSTSHLYVRLEHDKSYVLYGDFTTQGNDPTRQLGAYQRSLTGAKAHVEEGPVAATAFASRATSRQVVDEIKANGTSGPFLLSNGQPRPNSETISILVRDRNQPALVLRTTALTRFTDYDIDALTGRLLLRAPVPSVDPDSNPESIRVSYEADAGGPSFPVAGAEAKVKLGDKVEAGMSLVMDKDPLDTMNMASASVTFRPDERTTLTLEAARTSHDLGAGAAAAAGLGAAALVDGRGDAQRIELKHDDDKLKIQAQAVHTDRDFGNPSSTIAAGRNEADLKASYAVGAKTRLVADVASTGDAATGDRRNGLLLGVERSLDNGAKLEAGVRHVQDDPGAARQAADAPGTDTSTVRAKYSAPVPGVAKATAFVEAEQDVHDAGKRLVAVGGDYRLTPGSRAYVRQEVVSSLTGELDLDASQRRNSTLVGVDSELGR
ncbi:MAG: SdrD B-like domain-containing protein, partial [Burkholderiaceae bacterium]